MRVKLPPLKARLLGENFSSLVGVAKNEIRKYSNALGQKQPLPFGRFAGSLAAAGFGSPCSLGKGWLGTEPPLRLSQRPPPEPLA